MSRRAAKLGRKQELAIAALLKHDTVEGAAAEAGVSVPTLFRWLALPTFKAAYRDARRAVVDGVVADLQRSGRDAVATLRANLKAKRPADQNRAALGLLNWLFRGTEGQDLADEVERLRALVEDDGGVGDAEPAGGGGAAA